MLYCVSMVVLVCVVVSVVLAGIDEIDNVGGIRWWIVARSILVFFSLCYLLYYNM